MNICCPPCGARRCYAQGFGRPSGLRGSLALMNYYSAAAGAGLNSTRYTVDRSGPGKVFMDVRVPSLHTAHAAAVPQNAPPMLGLIRQAEDPAAEPNPAQNPQSVPELLPDFEPAREIAVVPVLVPAPQADTPDVSAFSPAQAEPAPQSRRIHRPERRGSGLLRYKKWWMRREAELFVNGETVRGTPIYIKADTLRVINDTHSYYIPLEKIDFIRTNDGLESSFEG